VPETSLPTPDLGLDRAGPFLRAAGLEMTEISGSRVVGHIDLGPEQHTPWGVVHGGVYTTAVESAASVGASAAVAEKGQFAVGVHNATDFLRAMTKGRVDVEAVPAQQSRVQQLWDVRLTNAEGKLVARGSVRLQNVTPRG
jgi:1,4-dihydroxy-2-naphthoyl-CoA hydrolase